jgi:putative ABC transport system permease protein
MLKDRGALVRPELLTALALKVGDPIVIGQSTFTIRGVILNEPGRRIGGFSLGPRVLVDSADLQATGLLSFGSRVRRVLAVRLPENRIEPLVTSLRDGFTDEFVTVRSYRGTDDEVGRDFERAENYLSMVGLVIVILGGIAVSSVTRVFVHQKMRSIAVLKCVGARSRQIISVYMLQVMALGLAGSLLGVALASVAIAAVPLVIDRSTPLLAEAEYGVSVSAAAQGIGIGVLVSLLFSVVPLLHIRLVKPSLLLRDESAPARFDWTRIAAMVFVTAALVALTAGKVSSLRIGLIVCAASAGRVCPPVAGRGLIRAITPLTRPGGFRSARGAPPVASRKSDTRRPAGRGLGAFFIVGVRSLQASLLEEFSVQVGEEAPDMFLMDIQRDQVDGVRTFLADTARGRTIPPASGLARPGDGRQRPPDTARASRTCAPVGLWRANTRSPTATSWRRTSG